MKLFVSSYIHIPVIMKWLIFVVLEVSCSLRAVERHLAISKIRGVIVDTSMYMSTTIGGPLLALLEETQENHNDQYIKKAKGSKTM